METNMHNVTIFTDGACSGNPGPGGWGALLCYKTTQKELSGYVAQTTNNQMELTAAIEALKALKFSCHVTLTTDSNYVKDGITRWIHNWKKNNWKTSQKKAVKNKELWLSLDEQIQRHDVSWVWVKGHAGHDENERVDELARAAIQDNHPPKK